MGQRDSTASPDDQGLKREVNMLGFFETLLVLGLIWLLFKRHSWAAWGQSIRKSRESFKKALHKETVREVKEYCPKENNGLSSEGDPHVR